VTRPTLPGLSFFFPALNEEAHVEPLAWRALEVLAPLAERLEVIVVDDGSTDGTGPVADRLATTDPRVRVVHHVRSRGYGGAVRAGIRTATQPYIFFTDGDRQFDPTDFVLLLDRIGDADAVVGFRQKRSDPARRRFIAWVYNRVIGLLFGLRVRDADCAFKLFRRSVFDAVPLERVRSNGVFFSAELLIQMYAARLRIVEVGVPHHPRRWGKEKGAPPRAILRAVRDVLALRARLWLGRAHG
jgi:glycosyltransferase involved in cell wall biosynthesis